MTTDENSVLNKETKPNFKYCISSGLRNSAMFVVNMLNENGIEAKLVEVVDNNCIDREVSLYKPTHVIIEAYWVVPEKFDVLTKLHPKVKWIVRNHSELPFLANEGIAIDWTLRYLKHKDVYLAPNSFKSYHDMKKMVAASHSSLVSEYKIIYLPNYYPTDGNIKPRPPIGETINVGCFGAVRPLKNHLVQAVAAIHFARVNRKKLRFHINVARIEDAGNNVLKSLRGLFKNLDPNKYELVEHGWLDHKDFLELVNTMDIGLQASFTESFNIVAADFVSMGVPMVVSEEIEWMPKQFVAKHTDSQSIYIKMEKVLRCFNFWKRGRDALINLLKYNKKSKKIWVEHFKYY